jgi:hypothetical protein
MEGVVEAAVAIADRGVAEAPILASPAGFAFRAVSLAGEPAGDA